MKKLIYIMMVISLSILWGSGSVFAGNEHSNMNICSELSSRIVLTAALGEVVSEVNGYGAGLGTEMWLTVVNRDGIVCNVIFSGEERGDQWPGSRVISAQKANTANAFSLPGLALSTANIYAAVQPGGSLYGLQFSNPVNTDAAYGGNSSHYGQANDYMKGEKIGGVNVFGGGLALYNSSGKIVGAIGLSGNTSCADHIIAWKVRDAIGLDNVPSGVSSTGDDNIILDMSEDANGHLKSAGGFGHATCGFNEDGIATGLPETNPIGENLP